VGDPDAHPILSAPPLTQTLLRESISFVGGGAAALLQSAHPFVAKGIFDHSEVLTNPLSRFERTFHYMFRIVFGDLRTILQSSRAIRRLHNRVFGSLGTSDPGAFAPGEAYSAHDREAVKWVYATLLETNVFLVDLMVHPLSPADRADIIRHSVLGSFPFGLSHGDFPSSYEDFERYYFAVCHSSLITVTEEAREICQSLMRPLPIEKHLPVNSLKTVTGVLLPEPVALQYGFSVGFGAYLYSASFLAMYQIVYNLLPGDIRYLTPYLSAKAKQEGRELSTLSRLAAKFADSFVKTSLGQWSKTTQT